MGKLSGSAATTTTSSAVRRTISASGTTSTPTPPSGGRTVTTAKPRGRPCRDALLLYSTPATGGRPHGAAPTTRPRPAPSSVATSGRATFPPRGRLTGHRKGRPYSGNRTVSVGSGNPGAGVEPHQRQFLQTQGPVARKESRKATQILRAGRSPPTQRDNPRKRGPGKGEYGHEVSILSRPRWRFGYFAAMGKVTRRPGPRPARKEAYPWRRNRNRRVRSLWTKINLHDYWCKIKMATSPKYTEIF